LVEKKLFDTKQMFDMEVVDDASVFQKVFIPSILCIGQQKQL
jgi:hypothetical protein